MYGDYFQDGTSVPSTEAQLVQNETEYRDFL